MKWLDGWSDRIILAVDHTQLPDFVLNLPILLVIDDTMIDFTKVNDDGSDIRIVPANHSREYPIEFEVFDKNNGIMKIWTKLDAVPSNTPTFFFLYYGNPSVTTSSENPQQLWQECDCYVCLHFTQNNLNYNSALDITGTQGGSGTWEYVSDGWVGSSVNVYDAYLEFPYNDVFYTHEFTLEIVFMRTSNPLHNAIFGTRFGSDYTFDFKTENDCYYHTSVGNGSSWLWYGDMGNEALPLNVWYHCLFTVWPDNLRCYHEGGLIYTINNLGGNPLLMKSNQTMRFANSWSTEYGRMHVDEFRIYTKRKTQAFAVASRLAIRNELIVYDQPTVEDMIPKHNTMIWLNL